MYTSTRRASSRRGPTGGSLRCSSSSSPPASARRRPSRGTRSGRPPGSGRGAGRGGQTRELLDQPIDLGPRVVVGQPDAHDAVGREAKPLDEAGRVEVAVPDRDATPAELLGGRSGADALDRDRGGGRASLHVRVGGQAQDPHAVELAEPARKVAVQ